MISVIIPVHNGIETLDRAVRSVLQQTVCAEEQVEILLVDDGSAEETAKRCDELAAQVRIRAFHMEDRGVSAARNLGIEHASGEYITFLDDDDAMAPSMLEELLGAQRETGADICGCGFRSVKADEAAEWGMDAGTPEKHREENALKNQETCREGNDLKDEETCREENDLKDEGTCREGNVLKNEEAHRERNALKEAAISAGKGSVQIFRGAEIVTQRILQRDTRVWSKLFTREAIGSTRFLEGLTIGEDMLFVTSLVRNNTAYAVLDEGLYFYTVNPKGAMERPFTRSYMDQIRCWDEAEKAIQSQLPGVLDHSDAAAQLGSLRIVSDVLTASKIAKLPEKEWQQYQPEFEQCRGSLGRHRVIPGAKSLIPKDYRVKALLLERFPKAYRRLYKPQG